MPHSSQIQVFESPCGDLYETEFSCANGVCTNENWFYKLSKCYYPKYGHFEYVAEGKTGRSSTVGFEKEGEYKVTIDVENGKIGGITHTYCLLSLVALAAPLILLARK